MALAAAMRRLQNRHHRCFGRASSFILSLLLLCWPAISLTQDGLYLLKVKSSLFDPSSALSNWNPRDPTPCSWTGVSCAASGDAAVIGLDLSDLTLSGPFNPFLCRLPSLSHLSLPNNLLNGTLPSQSLLPRPSLAYLDLSQNLLTGHLPESLHLLPHLRHLDLSGNNFSGPIPPTFALFPRLEVLSLVNNLLNHSIPSFLGNLSSSLHQLNLSYNPFAPGPIPPSLGNLTLLRTLWLTQCNLIGTIPASLGYLTDLEDLDLSENSLEGEIPQTLTLLTNAFQIELYSNALSGELPAGLSNLTKLRNLDASMNKLVGSIPLEIFNLPLLENLNLYQNSLVGPLPAAVANAKRLTELRLFGNQLSGPLPRDLGRNSPLMLVDLSQNLFSGEIPPGICDMGLLQELMLIENLLSGSLPEGLGRCSSLYRVRLSSNLLSGHVSDGVWGLPHVYLLDLARNALSGPISPAIRGAANLSTLILSDNHLSGSIPEEVGSLRKLYEFSAANNFLSGTLPTALGELSELEKLDVHNNSLSGALLTGVSKTWTKMTELNLAQNGFTGPIPSELGDLPVLSYLDLSDNSLSGGVPSELQNLTLNRLNLSNNRLSGKLPPLYATAAYRRSFMGNPGLCGDFPGLCAAGQMDENGGSGSEYSGKNHGHNGGNGGGYLYSMFFLAALVLLVGLLLFWWQYRVYRRGKAAAFSMSRWTLTSFHKLGFKEDEILDSLEEANVIGSGASGKVYRVVLSNGQTVAVKKLWGAPAPVKEDDYSSGSKDTARRHKHQESAFDAEVSTLGKIRHKNIVRLWCSCSRADCKLLVYEYMPNGSLWQLLHGGGGGGGKGGSVLLDWPARHRIALDAAEGLAYLHTDCVPPIVHRDVKSSNILLNADFGARIADFGVAKMVNVTGKGVVGDDKSMSVIAGSCGYIAPEYAYTLRVTEKSDTYSFGVVLLELITGKRPVNPEEYGEKDLVRWVCSTLEQKGADHVIDPTLLTTRTTDLAEEISQVLDIALQCTSSLPINRPPMRVVVKMLTGVARHRQPPQSNKAKTMDRYSSSLPSYSSSAGCYSGDISVSDQGSVGV